jgi:hypothetical protein
VQLPSSKAFYATLWIVCAIITLWGSFHLRVPVALSLGIPCGCVPGRPFSLGYRTLGLAHFLCAWHFVTGRGLWGYDVFSRAIDRGLSLSHSEGYIYSEISFYFPTLLHKLSRSSIFLDQTKSRQHHYQDLSSVKINSLYLSHLYLGGETGGCVMGSQWAEGLTVWWVWHTAMR